MGSLKSSPLAPTYIGYRKTKDKYGDKLYWPIIQTGLKRQILPIPCKTAGATKLAAEKYITNQNQPKPKPEGDQND